MTQEDKIFFNIHSALYHHERHNEDDVVYIRDDDFIKKACMFLKDKGNEYIAIVDGQLVLRKAIIKDFKNYMKGE